MGKLKANAPYAGLLAVAGALTYVLVAYPWFERVECLRSGPWDTLKTLTTVGDLGISAAYMAIPAVLVAAWRRMRARPEAKLLVLYGSFILLCGFTHAVGVLTILVPVYWAAAKLKVVTALVSVAVAVVTFRSRGGIVGLGESGAALAREAQAARRAEGEAVQAKAKLSAANQALAEINAKLEDARQHEAERAREEASRAERAETKNVDLEGMVRRLKAQDAALATLESPILEALDGVLVSVLVGTLSSARATEWTERLTAAVYSSKARAVVVDVTGLLFVDTGLTAGASRAGRRPSFLPRCSPGPPRSPLLHAGQRDARGAAHLRPAVTDGRHGPEMAHRAPRRPARGAFALR